MRTAKTLLLIASLALVLVSCSTPKQPPMPLGSLRIGLAYYTQPESTSDLLAGYMTEEVHPVDPKITAELDSLLVDVLAKESKNSFVPAGVAMDCARKTQVANTKQAALRKWAAVGRCVGVDLLVVPQIIEWRERVGSGVGVVTPAKVVMDTYVVDVRNESLISRSRYDETQSALSSNILDAGKFVKRGGKWVSTQELAREGMVKAVKELGL